MKPLLQIFLFLLTWFLPSATPVFSKVALPNYAVSFPKAESHKKESEVKIGVSNFARNGISENSLAQKSVLRESSVLENRAREVLRAFAIEAQADAALLLQNLGKDKWDAYGYKDKIENAVAIVDGEKLKYLITAKQRALGLAVLEQGRVGERTEEAILKLLFNTSDASLDDFLKNHLLGKSPIEKEKYLLTKLTGSVDDETLLIGEDNYKRFVQIISHLVLQSEYYQNDFRETIAHFPKSRTVAFYDQSLWSKVRDLAYLSIHNFDDIVAYDLDAETEEEFSGLKTKVSLKANVGGGLATTQSEIQYFSPFDLIYISNNSSLPMLASFAPKGTEVLMPAIALEYMDRKGTEEFSKDVANTTFDVLSLVTGTYQLKTTLTLFRTAVAASDMISGAAGLTILATKNEQKYDKLNKILNSIQILSGGINVIDFARSGKSIKTLNNEISNELITESHLSAFFQNIGEELPQIRNLPENDELRLRLLLTLDKVKRDATLSEKTDIVSDITKIEKELGIEDVAKELARVRGGGSLVRGINKTQFFETVAEFKNPANGLLGDQAWDLWKTEKWGELENLFKANNLNKYNGLSFPPNNGAVNVIMKTLDPADFNGNLVIDRYGATTGKFTAPANTPFPERALPSSYANQTPQKYKVLQPIPNVEEGQIIPWFNQQGLGIQYKLEKSVQYYIDEGYLQIIP